MCSFVDTDIIHEADIMQLLTKLETHSPTGVIVTYVLPLGKTLQFWKRCDHYCVEGHHCPALLRLKSKSLSLKEKSFHGS